MEIAGGGAEKLADATRATFPEDIAKIFRDLYPLLRFTSLDE